MIGDRIKYVRTALFSMSMEEFGKRLGVTKGTISRLESGSTKLTNQMCTSICREFGISEPWLMNGTGEPVVQDEDEYLEVLARKYNLDDFSVAFVKQFMRLDERDREAVRLFMHSALAEAEAREAQRMAMPAAVGSHEMEKIEMRVAAAEAAYEKRCGIATEDMSCPSSTGDEDSEVI